MNEEQQDRGQERQGGATDGTSFGDSVVATVTGPDGQVKEQVEAHDPEEYPRAPGVPVDSGEVIEHEDWGEVKGPDPAEWGERDEELQRAIDAGEVEAPAVPLAIGEVRNEGEEGEVKGPSEQWRQDDEGGYVNRD